MSKWKDQKEAEAKAAEEERLRLEELEAAMLHDLDQESELLKGFKERREKEDKRSKDVTDANYYFVVCFSNADQMEEFCDNFGLDSDEVYMDGREVARRFRKALKTPDSEFPRTQPFNKDYTIRAREEKH